jgi:ankyrin repeat protein
MFHGDYDSTLPLHLTYSNIGKQTVKRIQSHPLFLHECCKPFYDLSASIERGILDIVQYLISRGHNVNQETYIDNTHFEQCYRPLNAALAIPCPKILQYLLSLKNIELSYPFQSTFGNTIVHFVAGDDRVSKENMSLFLSRLNPDAINARDAIGKTPLHYACWFLPKDYEAKIEILLRAGANVNAFGNDYQDPLQVLIQAGRHRQRNVDDTEVLLKQYGAIEVRVGP